MFVLLVWIVDEVCCVQECSKVKEIEWLTKIKTVLKQLTKIDYEKVF